MLAKKSMPFDNKQRLLEKEYSWHNYLMIIDNFIVINNFEGSNKGRTDVSHSPKSGQNLEQIDDKSIQSFQKFVFSQI